MPAALVMHFLYHCESLLLGMCALEAANDFGV